MALWLPRMAVEGAPSQGGRRAPEGRKTDLALRGAGRGVRKQRERIGPGQDGDATVVPGTT
eukprot:5910457-Alexandrium_andersonii.AAC.1